MLNQISNQNNQETKLYKQLVSYESCAYKADVTFFLWNENESCSESLPVIWDEKVKECLRRRVWLSSTVTVTILRYNRLSGLRANLLSNHQVPDNKHFESFMQTFCNLSWHFLSKLQFIALWSPGVQGIIFLLFVKSIDSENLPGQKIRGM